MNKQSYILYPLGDNALTIQFGNRIDTELNEQVHQIYHGLIVNRFAHWQDIIPAYTSITIIFNKAGSYYKSVSFEQVKHEVEDIIDLIEISADGKNRKVRIPVCYDACFSLDGEVAASSRNMTITDLVEIHTSRIYHVYMIGFLPGFAYMGSVDARIAVPRLAQPRTSVPAGSVGIAGEQTGIYPLDSPGGWNIIGRTPLQLFEPKKPNPVLLNPGDEVMFIPLSKEDYDAFDSARFQIFEHEHTDR